MKRNNLILACLCVAFLWTQTTRAEVVNFTDGPTFKSGNTSYYVWPGTETKTVNPTQDVYGIPNLLGGSFQFTGSSLTKITLQYQNNNPSGTSANLWNAVTPMDWFFDIDPTSATSGAWDYVIHRNSNGSYELFKNDDTWGYGSNFNYVYKSTGSEGYPVFGTNVQETYTYKDSRGRLKTGTRTVFDEVYVSSHSSYGSPRSKHPVAAAEATLDDADDLGAVKFSGWSSYNNSFTKSWNGKKWVYDSPILTATWDLSGIGGLDLSELAGHEIRYGFALSCANDVLFGETRIPNPEPTTMLLMGAGMAGAAFMRRRKKS